MSYFPIRPVWSFFLNSKPRVLINNDIIGFIDKIITEESQILAFESEHEDLENFSHKRFPSKSKLKHSIINKHDSGFFDCKLWRFIVKGYYFLFPSNLSFIGLLTLLLLIWLSTYLPSDKSYTMIGIVTILAAILIKLVFFKAHKEVNKEAKYALSIIHNGIFADSNKIALNPGDIILIEFKASNLNKMPKHLNNNNFEELQSRIIIFKTSINILNEEERLIFSQNFAENLIKSEMELESNFNLKTFSHLIQLYTYAIMFYKDLKESKRKIFKQRLQSLLLKIDLIKLSNSEFQHKEDFPQKHNKIHRMHKLSQRRQPSDDFCIEYWHPYNISEIHEINAEETIERHNSSNVIIWNKIQEDMKNQTENLSSRIDTRRKTIINQSFSSQNTSNLSDRSDLEDFEVKFELYQLELEEIMDRFVDKAIKETMEIKNKYKESAKKFEDIDNIFVQNKMRVEAEKIMKKEIDETNQKIDEEKKKIILALRQKFKLL